MDHKLTYSERESPSVGSASTLWVTIGVLAGLPAMLALAKNGPGTALLIGGTSFVGLAVYLLPTVVAMKANKSNTGAIFMLNLLLGWTLLGWVVAMVWACTKDHAPIQYSPAPHEPAATRYADLADTKPCPFCAEPIKAVAIKCKHCGSDLNA